MGKVSPTFLDSNQVPFDLALPSAGPYVSGEQTMPVWKGVSLTWNSLSIYAFLCSPNYCFPTCLKWKNSLWLIITCIILLNCLFHTDYLRTFCYFILLISFFSWNVNKSPTTTSDDGFSSFIQPCLYQVHLSQKGLASPRLLIFLVISFHWHLKWH